VVTVSPKVKVNVVAVCPRKRASVVVVCPVCPRETPSEVVLNLNDLCLFVFVDPDFGGAQNAQFLVVHRV